MGKYRDRILFLENDYKIVSIGNDVIVYHNNQFIEKVGNNTLISALVNKIDEMEYEKQKRQDFDTAFLPFI